MKRKVSLGLLGFLKKHIIFILFLLLVLYYIFYSYDSNGLIYGVVNLETGTVSTFLNSFGFLAVIIFVILVALEVVVAPVPPLVLYLAGGFVFGPFVGGLLALLGNLIGALIAFEIARRFGRGWIEKRTSDKSRRKFDKMSEKYGAFAVFLLRLNPFTNSDIVSYLAGLTKMSRVNFCLATILGLFPYVFIQTYIGGDILKENPILTLLFIWIGVAYIAIFFYVFWLVHRSKK